MYPSKKSSLGERTQFLVFKRNFRILKISLDIIYLSFDRFIDKWSYLLIHTYEKHG